jgi:uncharacterized membrane-anchored protein YitT (DUF2179 family)
LKHGLRRESLNAVFILAGILSASMGIKGFLLSSNFIDGGVTGVSMLHRRSPVCRFPCCCRRSTAVCRARLSPDGRGFAMRSTSGSRAAPVARVRAVPDVTPDLVLTAVFGGFFLGAGSVSRFAAARCSTGPRLPRC